MGDLQLDDADAASLLGSVVDQCELSELLDTLTQSQDGGGGCGGGSGAAAALVMAAADIADFSLDSLDSLGAGVGAGLASSDTAAAAAGGGCISNDALSTQFDSSQQPGSAFNSELIDRLSCGFTSHSTQNMSFQRRFQSLGLVWKKLTVTQQKHAFINQKKRLLVYISYASSLILFSSLFLTYLLPYLSFPLRIYALRFQAICRKRQLNLALVFCVYFVL